MIEQEKKYVKLSDKYYVGVDKYNWILYLKTINKNKGIEEYTGVKFYPTLESLLSNVQEMKIRELCLGKTDLKELIKSISAERESTLEQIKEFCEGIKRGQLSNEQK